MFLLRLLCHPPHPLDPPQHPQHPRLRSLPFLIRRQLLAENGELKWPPHRSGRIREDEEEELEEEAEEKRKKRRGGRREEEEERRKRVTNAILDFTVNNSSVLDETRLQH